MTGIVEPSDVSLAKKATDVLLLGSAWAPRVERRPRSTSPSESGRSPGRRSSRETAGGRTVPWASSRRRRSRSRRCPSSGNGPSAGSTGRRETAARLDAEARNPAGTGFRLRVGGSPIAGTLLPNVEHPSDRVRSPGDRPAPCGFGPLAPHWLPRRSWAGTYDGAWARTRAPYLPADFDVRFLQCAPENQVVAGVPQGGRTVPARGPLARRAPVVLAPLVPDLGDVPARPGEGDPPGRPRHRHPEAGRREAPPRLAGGVPLRQEAPEGAGGRDHLPRGVRRGWRARRSSSSPWA